MPITITLNGKLFTDEELIRYKGIGKNGKVQKFIDNECIKQMEPYTPNRNGMLTSAIRLQSVIGSGYLIQDTPYARYLYYGEKYIDPVYKIGAFYSKEYGFWSRKGVAKIPSGIPLQYSKAKSPKADSHWFERMKSDKKDEILEGAKKLI